MASDRASETRSMSVGTADTVENFVTGCKGCILVATADCYVAFDENADAGSFLMVANTPVEFSSPFTQIHAIRTGGASTLHIFAYR